MVLSEQFPEQSRAQIRTRIKRTPANELLELMRSQSARKLMQLASDNLGQPGYTKLLGLCVMTTLSAKNRS